MRQRRLWPPTTDYGAPPADLDRHLARLKAAYPDIIESYDNTRLLLKSGDDDSHLGRTDRQDLR